jgi:translation initiation factor 3 subunit K
VFLLDCFFFVFLQPCRLYLEMPGAQVPITIEQLVALNPYNPDILPDLENYVEEQVVTQTYSLDANLCLLRLYQFQPARLDVRIVARMLVKALMALPATDFNLCMFLIPERLQMEEPFLTLATLAHFLETAHFREFWDEANRNRDILEVVPGFERAIQGYAIHVLSITYQRLPRSILAEAINVEGLSLDKFLEYQVNNYGWTLEKGGQLVVLPANEDNHPVLRKSSADSIPLEHVARLFPVLG